MHIWVINVGEPLPIDQGTWRPWRVGVTSRILADRGHSVTWWTSSMNHHNKTSRFNQSTTLPLFENARLILLHGRRYQRNLSWERILNHRQIAQEFHKLVKKEIKPDVIFCSLPTLELAREAVRYGKTQNIPVVIDIRDQWPDFMVEQFPHFMRPLAKLGLEFMYRDLREACQGAVAITGNAPALVEWGVKNSGRKTRKNDRYFPHGYPDIEYSNDLMAEADIFWDDLGLSKEPHLPTICFIGSVRYTVIDFETVLSGFKPLANEAQLVIAGNGDDLNKLKQKAEGIPNIFFSGWIDGPAVKTLMQRSELGLAPYRNSDNFKDSLPNKFVEYMSESLPTVSSLEGFSRNLLSERNCAGFFTEGDPSSLTKTLKDLLGNNALRQEMGLSAKALYQEQYSAKKLYGELSDFLENIATTEIPNSTPRGKSG